MKALRPVRDERIYKGSQSLYGSLIVRDRGRLIRASIRRDSYDDQCSAVVETWCQDLGWREVQTVPIHDLPVFKHSYATQKPWQDDMRASLVYLGNLALEILADEPQHDIAITRKP